MYITGAETSSMVENTDFTDQKFKNTDQILTISNRFSGEWCEIKSLFSVIGLHHPHSQPAPPFYCVKKLFLLLVIVIVLQVSHFAFVQNYTYSEH